MEKSRWGGSSRSSWLALYVSKKVDGSFRMIGRPGWYVQTDIKIEKKIGKRHSQKKRNCKKLVINVRLKEEGHSCKWHVLPSLNIAAHPILVAYPCPE